MNIVFFILPLALAFAGVMVWAFFWAARKGQFDDLDTPALRVLMDDEFIPKPKPEPKPTNQPAEEGAPEPPEADTSSEPPSDGSSIEYKEGL